MASHRKALGIYKDTGGIVVVLFILLASVAYVFLGVGNETKEPQKEPLFEIQAGNCSVGANDIALDPEEQSMGNLINQYRSQNGLPSLPVINSLTKTAAWMANDMAANNHTNHTDSLGRSWDGRLADCGYGAFGVDILAADANPSPSNTLNLWKGSSHHNIVILNQVADINGGAPHTKNWQAMGIARVFDSPYYRWAVYFGESNDGSGSPGTISAPTQPPGGLKRTIPSCSNTSYQATLSWSGSGQGWFVDISEDSNFSGWSNKDVSGQTSTTAPNGFSLGLTLEPGKTYYWRLWDTVNTYNGPSFSVPLCGSGGGGGTTDPTPTGTGGGCGPNPPVCTGATPDLECQNGTWACVPDDDTPAPTATRTPTPTRTPTATTAPGQPTATSTTAPGQPTATSTIQPTGNQNASKAQISISIPGVGSNTAVGENPNPKDASVDGTLIVYSQGNEVNRFPADMLFNSSNSRFSGEFNLGSLPSGLYELKTKTNNSLIKDLGIVQLTPGQTYTAPSAQLVTGDMNFDNILDLQDYNSIITCIDFPVSTNQTTVSVAIPCVLADFNIDGIIDERDLNIFYSGLANRRGD